MTLNVIGLLWPILALLQGLKNLLEQIFELNIVACIFAEVMCYIAFTGFYIYTCLYFVCKSISFLVITGMILK